MPNEPFPNRPCDGTVGDLINHWDYTHGTRAVRYLELGRGICTAYRDDHGRYRIRLEGTGVQERPITEEVKTRPAWWVTHDGNGGEPLPPLRYHKVKDANGIVHFRADVASMVRVLLCGQPHDDDTPPEQVNSETDINCLGCIAREGVLTKDPVMLAWCSHEGWYGPYP